MKNKFSKKWKASKQPRKQRKYRANAFLHIKHKFVSANLSKELRKKYNRRNIPLIKGDQVKIMRGEFKGKINKIEKVNIKKSRVMISNINRTKKDGSKIKVYFDPSNLQLTELNLEDKKRIRTLERRLIPDKKFENKPLKKNENQRITNVQLNKKKGDIKNASKKK